MIALPNPAHDERGIEKNKVMGLTKPDEQPLSLELGEFTTELMGKRLRTSTCFACVTAPHIGNFNDLKDLHAHTSNCGH